MRVGSLAAARPAYYDRNATTMVQSSTVLDTPNTGTTRWTTTVASGKKLLIESGLASFWRETAATTAGQVTSVIRVTSGGVDCDIALIKALNNTVSSYYSDKVNTPTTLYVGETLSGISRDNSTGGSMWFEINVKGTTYDA